ncbi:AtpZ/AtpI family protein [Aliarcobacter thereius]|uniref:F0F1-ATPase subunit (ATPase_gene1) n=1 Tax=Aliarcobacter thereius LMG 24486 TaxID=1032240 RepID=A0A1C7WRM2_9BACT|nr:AtpZ/AtpI family protein [Aliarcobacter thereius]OCL90101.1 putative F0F1-ATPase subunit (ATPase_gene1) [Aliarcobacter thereius]OCL96299.1 putative F0F1-ATPase subunit (ATPase_gene1) [Aliarcobacter thereius LMG 24486]QBF15738.1 putative ATPase-related protein [Aliarcobacter thereius LMG 24486]TLS92480.1 AtpZ/AtpI family protein [Aliarcobacter thereius]HJE03819.1 AtpZ/AtpI family protein [Aliarcobacter thereius]
MSENKNELENSKPKHRDKIQALDSLSVGISMVAAIVIGVLIGLGLKHLTGQTWTLFLGVFWGIAAAVLNVYKAYKRAQKVYEGMENDPRYSHRAKYGDKSVDDEDK